MVRLTSTRTEKPATSQRAGVPLLTFPNFEAKFSFGAGLHGEYFLNQNGL